MAPISLAGFERVELASGRSTRIKIHIGLRAFSYWSAGDGKWKVAEGRRPVLAGSSSRDIRLRGIAEGPGTMRTRLVTVEFRERGMIPFVDLKAQYHGMRAEIDTAVLNVLENS